MRSAASFFAGVALLATGCGGGGDVPPLPEGRSLAVTQSLTPTVQLFAEPVVARVDVLVDGERFDPDRVRVAGFFEPFELDGEVVRERRDQGRYTHLRYEFTLRCLVWECLPHTDDPGATPVPVAGGVERPPPVGGARDRRVHKLKAARVLYDDPQEGTQRVSNVAWPEVVSVSRLNFSDRDVSVLGFPFEASVTPLPEASYRFPPTLVGIGLVVGALALLALPAGLLVSSLRRKPAPVVEPEEPELTPLERALRLVEWAGDGEVQERREALEVLAAELDSQDNAELAGDARRLAWSRESPSPEAAGSSFSGPGRSMMPPLDLRRGIPASEPARLRDVERRTTVVRLGLAFALCATLVLAFLAARSQDVRHAPLVPSGTTGMLVLDLSASVSEGGLDATVEKLSSTDERTGLVVFSDGAYELLPPGSPSRELASLLRYFKERSDGTLPRNPWEEFRGGTRISSGMEFARQVLHREGVARGSIVLVSDLEIDPDEIARLSEVLALIRSEGYEVRIVPLFPSEEKRALVEQLVGSTAFVREPEAEEELRTPEERTLSSAAPWLFLLAGGLLIFLLAGNEGVLARLEVPR